MFQISSIKSRLLKVLSDFPSIIFFGVLAVLIALIAVGQWLGNSDTESTEIIETPVKVETYNIGSAPVMSINGMVEKTGVVEIVAQSSGVVQSINKKDGDKISRGEIILKLSTNYQGGNIQNLQKAKAWENYQNNKKTLDLNKEVIETQRKIAKEKDSDSDKLRKITKQSIDDTEKLLDLNDEIYDNINKNIKDLESISSRTADQENTLWSLKSQKAQLESSINQLTDGLRRNKYEVDNDNPNKELDGLQTQLTLKQLELQEKSLILSLELSRLDYNIAAVSAALMYPASPFTGIVEIVTVKVGDVVNPGQVIAVVAADKIETKLVSKVSKDIARNISKAEPSRIDISTGKIDIVPSYISTEPVDGGLYSIIYDLNEETGKEFSNGELISIEIPIGYADTSSSVPFIPLDSIYQTENSAYVFIVRTNEEGKDIASSVQVALGEVYGKYVVVKNGLNDGDMLIINRNVSEGKLVEIL